MAISVNSNASALKALLNLTGTNRQLEEVQSRISTGLKVDQAKDNGAVFAAARDLRTDLGGLQSATQSIDRGISTLDSALFAGEAVSDLLIDMKNNALSASAPDLTDEQRDALNDEFVALRDQLSVIVDNAAFNGTNLLKAGDPVRALADADGSATIDIEAEDLQLGGPSIVFDDTTTLGTSSSESTAVLTQIEESLANVNAALARLGTGSKTLDAHKAFLGKLSDNVEMGVGNLVDADLAKESAREQTLQIKQQLGIQALSIANNTPQSILSLLRG